MSEPTSLFSSSPPSHSSSASSVSPPSSGAMPPVTATERLAWLLAGVTGTLAASVVLRSIQRRRRRRRRRSKDNGRVITVVVAVEEEARYFRQHALQDAEELPPLGGIFRRTRGRIGPRHNNNITTSSETKGATVELIISKIGTVHAAACAFAIATLLPFRPLCVLNSGCSGAHSPALRRGDVVIGTSVVPLDSHQLQAEGSRLYGGFRDTVEAEHVGELHADERLVGLARKVGRELLPAMPAWNRDHGDQESSSSSSSEQAGAARGVRLHEGCVGSTDVWTQHPPTLRAMHDARATLCEEMESGALAWIFNCFGIPFLAIKDISNNELHELTAKDGGTGQGLQLEEIGFRAAMLATEVIRAYK